jgi:aminopeptidase N
MAESSSLARLRQTVFGRLSILMRLTVVLGALATGLGAAELEHECLICRQMRAEASAAGGFGIDLEGPGFRYAPDRLVDVVHIRLDVTPNFQRHTVRGTTSITFRPLAQPQQQLRLDAIDLTIHRVWGDGVEVADFAVSPTDVVVRFREPIPTDREVTLHLEHEAEPQRGFYFRTADMGYPAGDTHVWTQGEAHEARYWFPCFDYPNERSTTEVICHVPPDMTVLSNGRKLDEQVDADTGLKRVHWLQDKPHVNYLICLVAGHLEMLEDRHRDVPLGFYAQPSLAQHAKNSFQDTAQIMAYFEEEIGVPYPWDKYDQVTILDFVAGGMENTTLTTLTHNTIFSTETENLRSTRSLDAHELAHQWFGDYVTCKDWSHLWLNEGFATYYTHLYEGHKFGRDAMLYGLYRDARGSILTQADDKKPIVYKAYSNAREQFDYRAYPKGSWVLHMLRSQMGEDLYRRAIKVYLERHALQSVVTDDLRQVFEELSGRPLDRFFDQWVYHPRFPDLKIDYQWQSDTQLAKIQITQTQTVTDEVLLYAFPAKLRFYFDEGSPVDHAIQVDRSSHEFLCRWTSSPVW